jgi:hypothetical protein
MVVMVGIVIPVRHDLGLLGNVLLVSQISEIVNEARRKALRIIVPV